MALAQFSALEIKHAKPGVLYDGGGLEVHVQEGGARAVFRYVAPGGQRRSMGLGSLDRTSTQATGRSLAEARRQAHEARALLARGVDPIDHRKSQREQARVIAAAKKSAAAQEHATLARVARDYHARVIEPTRIPKHAAQWIASLENNVPQDLWHRPIQEVTAPLLLDVIAALQFRIPETASRIRQRLEVVFEEAEFREISKGNPARAIRQKLGELKKGRRVAGHFAALPFAQVPGFMQRIREAPGVAARALEFGVLTAARTREIIGAEWKEFDFDAGIWTIPAERMKGNEEHVVFLSPSAIQIVKGQQGRDPRFVFLSPVRAANPLSNMGMLTVVKRLGASKETTVHGLCRSSFSTWAYENGVARPEVIEAALAHREKDLVKRAYNRAHFNAERRNLLMAWADFVSGESSPSKVRPLRPRAA